MEAHQLRKQLMEHKCNPCEREHVGDHERAEDE